MSCPAQAQAGASSIHRIVGCVPIVATGSLDRPLFAGDDTLFEVLPDRPLVVLVRFADLVLGVELKPKAGDEFELGFEVIDVFLFVAH
jgi:hypothetical protein